MKRSWNPPYPRILGVAVPTAAIALIAIADWKIQPNISLGALYFIPLLPLAAYLERLPLLAACLVCAILRESFSPFAFDPDAGARFLFVFLAYAGSALFVNEVIRSRRFALDTVNRLKAETEARRESEMSLHATLESTPVGMLLIDPNGAVRLANREARHIFNLAEEAATGWNIRPLVPALDGFLGGAELSDRARFTLETPANRADGTPFLARIWISAGAGEAGPVVAAAVADISDDARETQNSELDSLLEGSRVILGAVSHEIRTLAGAFGITLNNLRRANVGPSADLDALAALAAGLQQLASGQLSGLNPRHESRTELGRILHEISILAGPEFEVAGAELDVRTEEAEFWVRADHHQLLKALLNLANNAVREMGHGGRDPGERMRCRISVQRRGGRIQLEVRNDGPLVADPDRLFLPFQPGSRGAGLGLYVSRALLRSYGADLRYSAEDSGPCFIMDFIAVPAPETLEENPCRPPSVFS